MLSVGKGEGRNTVRTSVDGPSVEGKESKKVTWADVVRSDRRQEKNRRGEVKVENETAKGLIQLKQSQ